MTDKTTQPREQANERVPGIAHPTTYADLARITPLQLWNRWYPREGSISARDAFIAARSLPFIAPVAAPEAPIPMILHCPACGKQHVDASETHEVVIAEGGVAEVPGWTNPPHRSHLCHGCGHIWRPADVPTEGVKAIQTRGKADSPLVPEVAASEQQALRDGYQGSTMVSDFHGPKITMRYATSAQADAAHEVLCNMIDAKPAATTASASMEIGAGDPEAFFAEFCERQGYPSDSDMDAGLRATFYEGIRYCAVNSRAPAPITTASASIEDDPEFRRLIEYWRGESYGTRSCQDAWDELVTYYKSRATAPSRNAAPLSVEEICKIVAANTPGRINLSLGDLDRYIAVVRAALTQQSAAQAPTVSEAAYKAVIEACRGLSYALIAAREMVGHPDNIAFIDRALADPAAQESHTGADTERAGEPDLCQTGYNELEAAAKKIYADFPGADAHPWVEHGNSDKQTEARRLASAAMSATTKQEPKP